MKLTGKAKLSFPEREVLKLETGLLRKLEKLKQSIASLNSVAIAFSGGVDSTLLVKVAAEVLGKENVLAVTATSSTYPARELQQAKKLTKELGIRHKLIASEELEIDGFAQNPPDRCYFCKSELFCKLLEVAVEEGMEHVIEGSNFDDTGDYRPGMKAAREKGVISPLKEAKLTKQDVRDLSREFDLPTWNKPAAACLSSRFPYGQPITKEKLAQVEQAEDFLRQKGFQQIRVRHHGDTARIEVMPEDFALMLELAAKVNKELKELGFTYVTLDLGGFRSGSMNEALGKEGAV